MQSLSAWLPSTRTAASHACGAQVLQLAMGHGFKAAACVWQARRTNTTRHPAWDPAAPHKQCPKEDAARAAGELLAARDLPPAARAQAAKYLAAVSAMERGTAEPPAADKAGEGEDEGVRRLLVDGTASAQAPDGAAPAPPRRRRLISSR